jgi:hypothetical protein
MSKRRCFILGAGFSKCCGLPLAGELTPLVWRARARNDATDESPHPELVGPGDFDLEQVKAERGWIKVLFPSFECDPERDETWPDFEQLITALDESARYQEAFEQITSRRVNPLPLQAKKHLLRHLAEQVGHLTEVAPPSGLKTVETFLRCLDLQADSIVSFNWDVLLEVVAADLKIAIRYRDDPVDGLRLAKPHGSLNLVDSPTSEYEKAKGAINVHSLDTEFEYQDGGARIVLRVQNPKDSWLRHAWARERLLVEPNARKTYDSRWLQLQWVRALDMVRSADELIVIGFSLPEADIRPRLLLQLCHVNRPQAPRIMIVARNAEELRDRYKRLTGLNAYALRPTLEEWLCRQAAP